MTQDPHTASGGAADLTYWLALCQAESMSAQRKNTLLVSLLGHKATLSDFFMADPRTWTSLGTLTEEEIRSLSREREELRNTAFVAEDLLAQGYAMIPVMSAEYPVKIKKRLKYESPVLLFLKGNRRLLAGPSATVFGSRDPSDRDLLFAASVGGAVWNEGKILVSGEAQGCDSKALDTVLEHDGKAILAIPQGIMKFGSGFDRLYRHIAGGRVAVVSCLPPSVYRSAEAANLRNALILGLADDVFVACADRRGSTYALLERWLRRGIPMKARASREDEDSPSGTDFLIAAGASPL